jgi:hypothetical protein
VGFPAVYKTAAVAAEPTLLTPTLSSPVDPWRLRTARAEIIKTSEKLELRLRIELKPRPYQGRVLPLNYQSSKLERAAKIEFA